MIKPRNTGVTRVWKATVYSLQGLSAAWKNESAFRQECVIAVILLPVSFWIADSWVQVAVLMGVCFLVLIVELLNSAIEAVVDRVGHEHHDLAGQAKDMGSAAVMLSLILAVGTWFLIGAHNLF
ncbi:MAG: diacylglycerol kinase [Pseudomonadales bacterium]|jgi:diacylglycerol kinase (ATP)